MLDVKVFRERTSILLEWFNKELSEAPLKEFYNLIKNEFSDEQYVAACRMAMRDCQYFPTPKQLIELVKGSEEDFVESEWQALLRAAASDRYIPKTLSPASREALQVIGGMSVLAQNSVEQNSWLKKDFIAARKSFLYDQRFVIEGAAPSLILNGANR